MDQTQILNTVRAHLAGRLCCAPGDFDRDGVVFAANTREPAPFLEICTMGGATVVSASQPLLPRLKTLFEGKCRDEIFECPFVYGQTICYVPDVRRLNPSAAQRRVYIRAAAGRRDRPDAGNLRL